MEEQKRAEAISSAPARVPGADSDFETLIAVAKEYVCPCCWCLGCVLRHTLVAASHCWVLHPRQSCPISTAREF